MQLNYWRDSFFYTTGVFHTQAPAKSDTLNDSACYLKNWAGSYGIPQ